MPRTEVYQLRLTKSEKDELAEKARTEGVSIAKLIRWRVGLDTREEVTPSVADSCGVCGEAINRIAVCRKPSCPREAQFSQFVT